MNKRQARTIVRKLYGIRADVKISRHGSKDVLLMNYTMPNVHMLLGWGKTWEEAIEHSKKRLLEMNKRKRKSNA